jgi:serine/threonine-protein kinase
MDPLSSLSSVLADRYDIDREIGRGGMATVYLARDLRHKRNVAVKVLNPELGAVLGVERFLAEIQVTANLQHPNVLPLYDSGSGNGVLFYVMPYVEGESLRDRLERERQLPIDDAVRIATAVAGALDYAHRHGVVHRDLKPENILLQDGQPLVADFGIALAVRNAGGNRITQTGLSLGTPQYMSPEQATGERTVDGRADIYSMGAVLYEMLVGDPPHIGSSTQAVIAKLLTEKPTPVRTARETIPEHVAWAVDRSLAKLPADRWQTARDFCDALAGTAPGRGAVATREARPMARTLMTALPWALAAISAIVAGVFVVRGMSPVLPAKAYVSLPGASLADGFGVSPSGGALVYVGRAGTGAKQLFVRDIGQLDARPIPGTDGAQNPIWSPDGRRLVFDANGKVMRVARDGGSIDVVSASVAYGHDWVDNESIVLGSTVAGSGLRVVEQIGTPPREVTHPDVSRGDSYHAYPLALRGERAAFVSWGPGGLEDDYLGLADMKTGKYVLSRLAAMRPVAMIDDWLVYLTPDRRLMAARCDLAGMSFLGAPVTLEENAVAASITPTAALLVTGVRTTSLVRFSVVEPSRLQTLVEDAGTILSPRVSPDGRHVAYALARRDGADLMLYDLKAGTSSVLRSAPFLNDIAWLPDGRSLVYHESAPDSGLWRMSVEHPSERTLITAANFPRQPAVMPDGKSMVFIENVLVNPRVRGYVTAVASLTGPSAVQQLDIGRAGEHPAVSPNGRWLAVSSHETGQNEIYVRSLTRGGDLLRVSTKGGYEPAWSRDGMQLFYRMDRTVMMARLRETGGRLEVLSRDSVASFTISSMNTYDWLYDVGANPNELFVAAANEKEWQLVFAQRWIADARRRLGAARK